jgi:hypothetical protein
MGKHINLFANLMLIAILICLVALLVYAVQRSDLYPPGTMNKFYLIFSVGIILSALALKLPQTYKLNFVLSILSVTAAVYIFEIFLTCCMDLNLANPYAQAAKAAGTSFDLRTKLQVFLDLAEQGVEVYPSANISQFLELKDGDFKRDQIAPLGGVSAKTTLTCNESGEYETYIADEHGFNNPTGLYRADVVDIVLVGDSFTHGHCVSAGEDIASHLRKTGESVINLGYGGNGPLIKLATLKEYAEPLRPKIVLWLYYEGNDLEDLAVEQQVPLFLNYLERDYSQNLFNRQSEVDKILLRYLDEKVVEAERKSIEDNQFTLNNQLTQIVRLYRLRQILDKVFSPPAAPPPPPPLFEEILQEARDRTSAWGGKLYFVYLPAWQRYGTNADQTTLFHRDQVLSIVAKLDIPMIDIHEAMIQHPDPLSLFPFRLPGHYVAEGYELVASALKKYLEDQDQVHQYRVPKIVTTLNNTRSK